VLLAESPISLLRLLLLVTLLVAFRVGLLIHDVCAVR
jgi:hypothetical protein